VPLFSEGQPDVASKLQQSCGMYVGSRCMQSEATFIRRLETPTCNSSSRPSRIGPESLNNLACGYMTIRSLRGCQNRFLRRIKKRKKFSCCLPAGHPDISHPSTICFCVNSRPLFDAELLYQEALRIRRDCSSERSFLYCYYPQQSGRVESQTKSFSDAEPLDE